MPDLNVNEDLKQLSNLTPEELLKELSDARARFYEYLKSMGIDVPEIIPERRNPFAEDKAHSIILEEFTLQTISALNPNTITVLSTIKSLVTLRKQLPASKHLSKIGVTIEGQPPCSIDQLIEKLNSDDQTLTENNTLAVASQDLKALLEEIASIPIDLRVTENREEAEASPEQQVISLDNDELDNLLNDIPETSEISAEQPDIESVVAEELAEAENEVITEEAPVIEPKASIPIETTFGEFSPIIEQAEYDELFSEEHPSISFSELPAITALQEETLTTEEPGTDELPETLDQNDLDALFASPPAPKEETITPEAPGVEELPETLDQNDLGALFAAPTPPAEAKQGEPPEPEIKTEELPDTLDQNDLDALFAAPTPPAEAKKGEPPEPEIKTEELPGTLDQNDLDALFASPPAQSLKLHKMSCVNCMVKKLRNQNPLQNRRIINP